MGFGATTFVLSMFNVSARGVTTPNVVLGMALFYGGLVQLLAGMWEFAAGNTFGATAFSSYGGFWLSFACLYSKFPYTHTYTQSLSVVDRPFSSTCSSSIPNPDRLRWE
jgi:succinate-acetate transporter protein